MLVNPHDTSTATSAWSSCESLLGYAAVDRKHESIYALISRMMIANHLNESESRALIPDQLSKAALYADRAYCSDAVSWLTDRGVSPAHALSRVDPQSWECLPGFNSVPQSKLRICEICFGSQFHTWAWSSDVMSKCPLHGCELQETCPKCRVGLLRKGRTLRRSAFTCPRSCALATGPLSGLGSSLNELGAEQLEQHKRWIETVRQAVRIDFGPTHIAYPTYLEVAPYRASPTISSGLTMATLKQIEGGGAKVPAPLPWHDDSTSHWQVTITPWSPSIEPLPKDVIAKAKNAIYRDAYTTTLPILDVAHAADFFRSKPTLSTIAKPDNEAVTSGAFPCIRFPSKLLVANEIHALYRALSNDVPCKISGSNYQEMMLDLVEVATGRMDAIERGHAEFPQLAVAERVDALLN